MARDEDGGLATALFIECKAPKEDFGQAQEAWVTVACALGIDVSRLAVSMHPF